MTEVAEEEETRVTEAPEDTYTADVFAEEVADDVAREEPIGEAL